MKGLLYTIEKEKHNEKDLKELPTASLDVIRYGDRSRWKCN